jgi:hypothetical protein
LCQRNIVGNGSSPLMLRSAVEQAGGYDSSLRQRRAQGCEDYRLYFQIAEHLEFGLVRDYLTGYRDTPTNMSSDYRQMLRSRDICAAEIIERHPGFAGGLRKGRARLIRFNLSRAIRNRQFAQARALLVELVRGDPIEGGAHLLDLGRRMIFAGANGAGGVGTHFLEASSAMAGT